MAHDDDAEPVRWGGNRRMKKMVNELYEPGYVVRDMKNKSKKVHGMTVLTFVHYLMDWKSSTNASDASADMIMRLMCKLLCKFSHNYPKTWH